MKCKTCGAILAENVYFCGVCGTQNEPEQETVVISAEESYNATTTELIEMANSILLYGILSLVFSGPVGLFLAVKNREKVKDFVFRGGRLTGKAMAGKVLGIIGLVDSIITCVVLALYILAYASAFCFG